MLGERTRKEMSVGSDGEFWTSKTLVSIALLDKDAKHVKPIINIDEDARTLLTRTEKVIGQLRKVWSASFLFLWNLTFFWLARLMMMSGRSQKGLN